MTALGKSLIKMLHKSVRYFRSYGKAYWLDCIAEMGCPRNKCYRLKWWRTNYQECYTRFLWRDGQPRRKDRKDINDI